MASLISDSQKISLQSVMFDIHDTFARQIKAFKEGKEIILSSNPNYSHIYKQPLGNIAKTEVEKTIFARIYYFPRKIGNETVGLSNQDSLKLDQSVEELRLKINQVDYDFVKNAERFVIDGNVYQKVSSEVVGGLFGSGFYHIYMRRSM